MMYCQSTPDYECSAPPNSVRPEWDSEAQVSEGWYASHADFERQTGLSFEDSVTKQRRLAQCWEFKGPGSLAFLKTFNCPRP